MFKHIFDKCTLLLTVSVVSNFVQINGHLMLRNLKFDDHDKVSENITNTNALSEYIVNMAEIGPGLKGDPATLEQKTNDNTQRMMKEAATKNDDSEKTKDNYILSTPKSKSSLHLFKPYVLTFPTTTAIPEPSTTEEIKTTEITSTSPPTTTLPTTTLPSTTMTTSHTTPETTDKVTTPTIKKKNETNEVLPLNSSIIPRNLTKGLIDVSEVCTLYMNGSDVDIVKMIDVWRAVYFQSADDVSCIKIILKGVSVKEQVEYAKEYHYLENRVQWDKCFLEVKSTSNLRKHFLQGDAFGRGVFENIILVRNDTSSKMTLQSESPDQWRLIDDFLLMRDCDSGEVIVFSRVLKNPTKEELYRVLKIFGERKMTGKLTCKDEFEDEVTTLRTQNPTSTMALLSMTDLAYQTPTNKLSDDDVTAAEYEDLES